MNELTEILNRKELSRNDIIYLLSLEDKASLDILYKKAYETKVKYVGKKVFFRGIIEFSNICAKNCYYCGIRKDNKKVKRFMMTEAEILEGAQWAYQSGYGSLVLQAGERMDERFVDLVEKILIGIKRVSDNKLGITLSLGEQTPETYRRWFAAGAHRYLLRIETSNIELYRSLHPADHDFNFRFECLRQLRKSGYQVGTGVMIGLPGQTIEHLADDILFMKNNDVDMIGMGPFIPHKDTPLADSLGNFEEKKQSQLKLGLKMIAVTRLFLEDVNIAATTALQSLNRVGRELGLQAGANIIMPNITNTKYRDAYQLYDNKPCLDENSTMCKQCLRNRIATLGETIGYNEWGDSPHFFRKKINVDDLVKTKQIQT